MTSAHTMVPLDFSKIASHFKKVDIQAVHLFGSGRIDDGTGFCNEVQQAPMQLFGIAF